MDNIAEGLLAQGVAVVRVGRGDKVSPAMEARTLDALTAARKQNRAATQAAEAERRLAAEVDALRERLKGMDAHELRAYAEQAVTMTLTLAIALALALALTLALTLDLTLTLPPSRRAWPPRRLCRCAVRRTRPGSSARRSRPSADATR